MLKTFDYFSSLGWIKITASTKGITALQFIDKPLFTCGRSPFLMWCALELNKYFAKESKYFDVPLDFSGATDFNREVWSQLLKIPYGKTMTYSGIAKMMGKPKAARAVGKANGANPIAIIVPCHRLVGKNGDLRGYAYGVERKEALLKLEGEGELLGME